jgi:hypothetical protein
MERAMFPTKALQLLTVACQKWVRAWSLRMYATTCLYSASLGMTRQLADLYLSSSSPSLTPVSAGTGT